MPKISVIVPIYNVQNYLAKCLDSIINQTFSDIEIVCVNDGSTDNSRKILEKYKNKDARIVIIDKENGGLSSARNAGMEVAKGEFLSFIDSDDWIDLSMLEKLYNNITTLNTDISICAVHQYDDTNKKIDDSNPYYTLGFFDSSFDNKVFSYKDTKPFIMDVCVMAWNKLYRKSFIDDCKAEFPDGLIFEDGPFFFNIFFKTNKVSIIRDFLYFYRINRKGSIIQKAGKKYLNVIDVAELMLNHIKDLEDFEDIKYIFFRKKIEDFIYRFEQLNYKNKCAFAKKIKEESSFSNENLFSLSMIKGELRYFHFLFQNLKTGNILYYDFQKFKIKLMYKIMEFLYFENNVYCIKYKYKTLRIKKRPNFYDFYYLNDKIYVVLFNKIKFNFDFKYSELEKFNEDD